MSCNGIDIRFSGGERNDALVNTSTLAWLYTGDDEVKENKRVHNTFTVTSPTTPIKNANNLQNKIKQMKGFIRYMEIG